LRYHEQDYIRVDPGSEENAGSISALLCDGSGEPILELKDNEWIGSTASWDIDIVGRKLKVRHRKARTSLALRLEPPGEIVVEWLDMRIGVFHILATEHSYAVGAYVSEDTAHWTSVDCRFSRSTPLGCAIEIGDPQIVKERYDNRPPGGQGLSNSDGTIVMHSGFGVSYLPTGIVIGSGCSSFDLRQAALAPIELETMRKALRNAGSMDELCEFMGNSSP
jgi:hypothetical protein